MPEPPAPPLQTSKVRTGLRTFAWFLPGITAPGFLLLIFIRGYGGSPHPFEGYLILGGFLLLTLGCAFFNAILELSPPQELERPRNKRIAKAIGIFILAQTAVVPVLGMGTAFGCSAILSLG